MDADRPLAATRTTTTRTRRRVVVDDSDLARRIGGRLRRARLAAGLTQSELAAGRYTKAYVSALENGQSKPSMAALSFFSDRLGMAATRFLDEEGGVWRRLEVDLALASGRFGDATDGYLELLDASPQAEVRAELLCGIAEAHAGLDRGTDAVSAAAEAAEIFGSLGRKPEAAIARYWLAVGQYQLGNGTEAEGILRAVLAEVRAGLRVEPDFEARLLMTLSSAASKEGRHAVALGYLEEIRSVAGALDDRRRGAFLYDLAYSYRETGDVEAAVRSGMASLALFRAAGYELGVGALENDLSLSYLALGNTGKAAELAASSAGHFEHLGDRRWLAHVVETQAQIALARGDLDEARRLADASLALADETGNEKAAVSALRTLARIERARGDLSHAMDLAERAADRARPTGSPGLIRDSMTDWAELLAETGQHERAFAILREAMQAG